MAAEGAHWGVEDMLRRAEDDLFWNQPWMYWDFGLALMFGVEEEQYDMENPYVVLTDFGFPCSPSRLEELRTISVSWQIPTSKSVGNSATISSSPLLMYWNCIVFCQLYMTTEVK